MLPGFQKSGACMWCLLSHCSRCCLSFKQKQRCSRRPSYHLRLSPHRCLLKFYRLQWRMKAMLCTIRSCCGNMDGFGNTLQFQK